MATANKNPSATFYWNDWATDDELKSCSMAAQGFWMRCLCIAAKAEEPGVLMPGDPPHDMKSIAPRLARAIGVKPAEALKWLKELVSTRAASVDDKGRVFNRRMVKAAGISATRSEAGKAGAEATHGAGKSGGKPDGKTGGKDVGKTGGNGLATGTRASRLQDSGTSDDLIPDQPPSPGSEPPVDGRSVGAWGEAIKAEMLKHWPADEMRIAMLDAGVAAQWIADGATLDDVAAAVPLVCADVVRAEEASRKPKRIGLSYFGPAIERHRDLRLAGKAPKPPPPTRTVASDLEGWAKVRAGRERVFRERGEWNHRDYGTLRPDQPGYAAEAALVDAELAKRAAA